MSGYDRFCPVALGAEVLAIRWTPLIVRELLHGSIRFSELQRGLPRISRNLLVQRLATLKQAGVIESRPRTGRGRWDDGEDRAVTGELIAGWLPQVERYARHSRRAATRSGRFWARRRERWSEVFFHGLDLARLHRSGALDRTAAWA